MNNIPIVVLATAILVGASGTSAQTNIFPASGDVGIGTTSPSSLLTLSSCDNGILRIVSGNIGGETYVVQPSAAGVTELYGVSNWDYAGAGTSGMGFTNINNSNHTSDIFFHTRSGGQVMTIKDSGNVGVGTTSPRGLIDVVSAAGDANDIVGYFASNASTGTSFTTLRLEKGAGYGGDISGYLTQLVGAGLVFSVLNAGASAEAMRINQYGNVGIGTVNPTYPLTVNGTIRAKEVIVDTGWSDFVFEPGYRLMSLGKEAAYIRAHRHLPDMPSASEVKTGGVSVGEMQSKLLAKVEELTLHLIQLRHDNDALKADNAALEKRVAALEAK